MPDIGLMKVKDSETGECMYVDTPDGMLEKVMKSIGVNEELMSKEFSKNGIDLASVRT